MLHDGLAAERVRGASYKSHGDKYADCNQEEHFLSPGVALGDKSSKAIGERGEIEGEKQDRVVLTHLSSPNHQIIHIEREFRRPHRSIML